jgi:zeaxanthin glucosyltransferase
LRLLDRAALAITHAGLNTVLECIARGVPMVCIPVTNDQPGIARRVEWLGLGEVLPAGRATARRLRPLIEQVLDQPQYRQTAAEYQSRLMDKDGLAMATNVALRALETGQPVWREDLATTM